MDAHKDEFCSYTQTHSFDAESLQCSLGHGFSPGEYIDLAIPLPGVCPCCQRVLAAKILPVISINYLLNCEDLESQAAPFDVVSIYKCTACNNLFCVKSSHKIKLDTGDYCDFSFDVIDIFPKKIVPTTSFSAEIKQLSEEFSETFGQAEIAEENGLNKICGIGYRRALEFLVDAYVRKRNPGENIDESMPLSKKIDRYIPDDKIQALAKAASWIGNDEAHIERKHPDKDIRNMKRFIRVMVAFIELELASEEANDFIS